MDILNNRISRQNALNNTDVIAKSKLLIECRPIKYKDNELFTVKQVADLFEIDKRTVRSFIEKHSEELSDNGYMVLSKKNLKEFKKIVEVEDPSILNLYAPSVGVFTYESFIDFGMIYTGSKIAEKFRKALIKIITESIKFEQNKFINRKDPKFIPTAVSATKYRKKFTDSINNNVKSKNPNFFATATDSIYLAVFGEKAKEYRNLMKLTENEPTRATFYSEILNVIGAFENVLAIKMDSYNVNSGKKINTKIFNNLLNEVKNDPFVEPILENARIIMASRDKGFRNITHQSLIEYIKPLTNEEYKLFLNSTFTKEERNELIKAIELK